MKKLLTILPILLTVAAFSQSLYVPTNPDSLKIPIQVLGVMRYAYMKDLLKNAGIKTQQDANTTAIANKQPLENQRLSTTNTPTFAGLTSNGILKLIAQSGTPAAPAVGTQNMYADSTGAFTIQGSNGFALAISKNRMTANRRLYVQDKDYTVGDSAVEAANTVSIAANTTAIAGKLTASNNLSDLSNAATARTNLGLGTVATLNGSFTTNRLPYYNGTSLAATGVQWDNTNSLVGINTTPTHTLTLPSTATGIALYNTVDQTTNYERVRMYWNSNVFTINTENGGTGVARNLNLFAAGGATLIGAGNGGYLYVSGSQLEVRAQPNGAAAGNAAALAIGTSATQVTGSLGMTNSLAIFHNINQSGTAGYRSLFISPLETATGTGNKYLIDAGTNSALNGAGTHTSKFSVTNTGNVTIAGSINAGNTITTTPGTTSIAPLNIPSGTLKTSSSSGDVENNGTNLTYTNSAGRQLVVSGTIVTGTGGVNKYLQANIGGTTYYILLATTLPN